ncbi:MAG: glutamate--cysteine ligase [Deltaproteobacteria bacterium]|nr:MAG: glutamate--cysteine ligase [Deltaproteobacteria bacterium]
MAFKGMSLKRIIEQFENLNISDTLRRGVEKECLRVTQKGVISQKPHPQALGSALTHSHITTDYSEALLEFVTPVFKDPAAMLEYLQDLHIFTLKNLDDEILWSNSMPCLLEKESTIPIADYGTSNIGKMKKVYRRGLLNRYGSAMQVIAGIHFNFSMTDEFFEVWKQIEKNENSFQVFKSKHYMNAARNIHKNSWLVPFVFGSSPAICRSFLNKSPVGIKLDEFDDKGTLSFDGATSLRLSNLGYTNSGQDKISISYNDIECYINGLRTAMSTKEERYEELGVKVDGEYIQLNSNLLQIENEYYSSIRPKRVAKSGESPTNALKRGGVEYLELRSVDVNAFSPIGLDLDQVYFLDVFLIYCMLKKNDSLTPEMTKKFRANQEMVARHGRRKNLTLFDGEKDVNAVELAKSVFADFFVIAEKLDKELASSHYTNTIQHFNECIEDSSKLYSERLLNEMRETGKCFFNTTLSKSIDYSSKLKNMELSEEKIKHFEEMSTKSLEKQKQIEAGDVLSFDEFLDQYFKQNT